MNYIQQVLVGIKYTGDITIIANYDTVIACLFGFIRRLGLLCASMLYIQIPTLIIPTIVASSSVKITL